MNLMMKRALVLGCLIGLHAGANAASPELASGRVIGKHIFGLARDHQQSPLMVAEDPLIHQGSAGHHEFVLAQQTYTVSLFDHSPGSVYLSEKQSQGEGYLTTEALDLEPVSGLARPVGGVKTPWGSLLFSESESVDAAASDTFVASMAPFFKGDDEQVNPYHYGWPAEVVLLESEGGDGQTQNAKVIKDYGVGRVSASDVVVMPDGKTVFLLDGDHSGNLYVFIAEQANSLTQGKLYGVLFDGRSVSYHELGEGAALKTKFRLRRASFDTFFEQQPPSNGDCPSGFEFADSIYGQECLKVQSRAQAYIGLFEPIRMMALLPGSEEKKAIQAMEFDAAGSRLSLIQVDGGTRSFALKPHSQMQSQYLMEVSP